MPVEGEKDVPFTEGGLLALRVVAFDRPRVFVRAGIQSSGAGSVIAFAGVPFGSSMIGTRSLNAGFSSVIFRGRRSSVS